MLLYCGIEPAMAQSSNEGGTAATQASKAFAVVDGTGSKVPTTVNTAGVVKKKKSSVTLYPDTVSDYLLVVLPVAAVTTTLVTVRSIDGTTVATDTIAAGATNTVIDVKQVPPGMYVITIDNVADKQVTRLVKN